MKYLKEILLMDLLCITPTFDSVVSAVLGLKYYRNVKQKHRIFGVLKGFLAGYGVEKFAEATQENI